MTYKFAFCMTAAVLLMCAGCDGFDRGGGSVDPGDGVNAYLSMFNPALRTYVSPRNGGYVSVFPPPANSDSTYRYGTVVTVAAVPYDSFTFDEWSGALTAAADTVRIVMDGNKTLTANFKPKEETASR
jgi:uncharacterized repeat protein (TIGR02543 family)